MQTFTIGGPGFDADRFLAAQPQIVRANAEQLLETHASNDPQMQAHLASVAQVLGLLGSASEKALRKVDDETKDTLCKAFASILKKEIESASFKQRGVMQRLATEVLDSVTPWCKDKTFVSMVLDGAKPNSIGSVIAKLVDALDDDVKLDIEHAETIVQVARNCALTLWHSSKKPSIAPLLQTSDGLFKALMHVCNHNDPRVNDDLVDIADTIKKDATAVRQLLAEGRSARRHLEHALEVSRAEGSMAVHNALHDLVYLEKNLVMPEAPGSPRSALSGSELNLNTTGNLNMCRWCNKSAMDSIELFKCPGCKSAHYCSKECQKRDWKSHKVACKKMQKRSGAEVKESASNMKTMEIQMLNFLQVHGKRVLRKMWEVAKHAEDTHADLAALGVPGGIERLITSPRLRDYLVNVDFGKGTWSVHLYEAFVARQDLPSWMLDGRDDTSLSRHKEIAEAVKLQYDKLEDRVQLLSVCMSASGRDFYCFRNKLFNKSDGTPVLTDESVLEFGRDGEAFSFDQGTSHDASGFQNGGSIGIREPAPSSDMLAGMDALRRMSNMSMEEMMQCDRAPINEREREGIFAALHAMIGQGGGGGQGARRSSRRGRR
ncbi:hypothetical protein PPROV_000248100 [Pycnococcus provasolii]|uniref:MYND-type domain-containing protein n=1 Tax=Pycnococcus provasolii TaxID=41880 RepID=A0A830H8Y7_9CHLO|nr:hypothetical protein PPROV_000248100 [Pycnococcus provasolii]